MELILADTEKTINNLQFNSKSKKKNNFIKQLLY